MNGFNTFAITLDNELVELFRCVTAQTGMSTQDVIRKLIPAHLHELWELVKYLEALPQKSKHIQRARSLLQNYGPDSLIDALKRLDSTYKTPQERFEEGLVE